jgi:hypothetical protein
MALLTLTLQFILSCSIDVLLEFNSCGYLSVFAMLVVYCGFWLLVVYCGFWLLVVYHTW